MDDKEQNSTPQPSKKAGKLVICPTPLGNLGDITVRTLDALRDADVVCTEDTRVTGKLLAAFDLNKRMERLDENMVSAKAGQIVERIAAGENIAYCTDAGMPGVSDPGLRLVKAAREANVPVEVLPGASAAVTAYVASGCTDTCYYFGGFFPRRDAQREALLYELSSLKAALVFYESPNRLLDTLAIISKVFPMRQIAVCRELTKMHEEVLRATAAEILEQLVAREGGVKGEVVIVIDGPQEDEAELDMNKRISMARERALVLVHEGMRSKQITRTLVDELNIARNVAYDIALKALSQVANSSDDEEEASQKKSVDENPVVEAARARYAEHMAADERAGRADREQRDRMNTRYLHLSDKWNHR